MPSTEWVARLSVAILFGGLCTNLLGDFLRTGHLTGLLLLVGESLVVVFTCLRRPAVQVDRTAAAAAVTLVSVVGPLLIRADERAGLAGDGLTTAIMALGLALVIGAKMTLGRSFGLVPANRGVVDRGPYAAVRHPIYAGYLLSHVGFLLAHPGPWNLSLLVVADGALLLRALLEERVLLNDERYQAYCRRVSWHVVPGVF